jgi:ArsR family transcriptional regulator, arsenate/arsenite/antimonite-responsive transcriptional repressor
MSSVKELLPVDELCCAPLTAGRLDERDAIELAGVLQALADPVRLRLISIIASVPTGEVCACDLPALLDRSQPTVSHHLSQLVRAGLLRREQRGKWAWFSLRPTRLAAVRTALGEGLSTLEPAGGAGAAPQP